MQYKKKPLTVEAVQWTGINFSQVFEFLNWTMWDKRAKEASGDHFYYNETKGLVIQTKEGYMTANIGDYIVQEPIDTDRGYYPVKENIFLETYDPLNQPLSFIDPNLEIKTLKEEAKWSDTQIANLKAQYEELSDAAARTEERYLDLQKTNETLQQDIDWFLKMVDDPVIKFEFQKRKMPPEKAWRKPSPLPPEPNPDQIRPSFPKAEFAFKCGFTACPVPDKCLKNDQCTWWGNQPDLPPGKAF